MIILIILTISSSVLALDFSENVPGKNYTYREFLMNRAIVNKFRQDAKQDQLQGDGMQFSGIVKMKMEDTFNEEGVKEVKKVYRIFLRGCGDVKVPDKDEKKMKKLNKGSRIKLYLNGSSCTISNWEMF